MSKKQTGVLVTLSATALLVVGGLAWEQVFPNRQANASEDASQLAQASAGTSAATDDQSEQALTYTPLPAIPADYDPSAGHFEYPEGYDTSKGEFVYPDDLYDAPHFKRYKEPEGDETVIPFGTSNTPRVQTIIPWTKACFSTTRLKKSVPRILMGPNATTQRLIGMATCWCGFPMQHTIITCLRCPKTFRTRWQESMERAI